MPEFELIVGQKQPIRILHAHLRNGTVPHALLFKGIDGIGKKSTAMTFAMACNCDERSDLSSPPKNQGTINPCGHCRSCRKMMSGNHPDIIHIAPSGSYIKIGQIRSLIHTLSLKPYEANCRTVLISEAHSMNPEASNALLKVLEEPPSQTVLILTARQSSDLLPTVVSRCQQIKFNPLSPEDLTELLVKKNGVDRQTSEVIAIMANGSYTKAATMIGSDWIDRRKWLLHASGLDKPREGSVWPVHRHLAFVETLMQNKNTVVESLEIMKSWLRDLVIFHYSPDHIINQDLKAEVHQASQDINLESLLAKIDAIQFAQKTIQSNANLKLALETMIFKIASA
ncbi:DNA polymerase III subunit delta' [Thermodesulfobacteriota bacterium]